MFIKKQHVDVRKSAQKVLEPKRDSLSRLKHLRVYLDNVETAEAKTFFEINYSHIYCIFHDVFTSLEGMLRQRVHKTQKEELDNVKYIFERILVLLPELLAQRWQWHSIRIIIRKFLHPGNSLRLRREGVRFFLLWYQILVPAAGSGRFPEPYQDSTFYTSVEVDSGPIVPCDSGPLMPPQSGEVQPENPTVTFLEFLMEYMVTQATKIQWSEAQDDNHHRCFEFLFEKFKKHFLPHIFPDFCYSNSIYKPNLELPSLRKDKKPATADSNAVAAQCRSVVVQWVVSHTQPAKLRKEDAAATSRSSDAHQVRKQDHTESGLERTSAPSGSSGGTPQSVHESHSVSSGSSSAPSLTIGSLTERDSESQLQQAQQSPPESGHRSLRQIQVVRNVLYSKRENVNLVHEVLRQAFLAPFSQAHTTKSVICTYRDWIQMASPDMPPFLVDPEGKDGKEENRNEVSEMSQSTSGTTPVKKESVFAGVQNMYQVFITNAANVFLLEVGPDEKTYLDEQVELCKRVMNIYRYMVMKRHMEKATWEQLLVVLLRVTSLVLKTTPPARKEDVLGGRLAPALFQTLIVTWIKANLHATISLDLWDGFLGGVVLTNTVGGADPRMGENDGDAHQDSGTARVPAEPLRPAATEGATEQEAARTQAQCGQRARGWGHRTDEKRRGQRGRPNDGQRSWE
ncbi:hypothetical protein MTO96_027798 [Rhipicephalus appendiculatus]